MKLRFHQNSLRFRLNQVEVAKLASGAVLVEEIWFPNSDQPFRYSLSLHESEASAALGLNPAQISVLLRRDDVTAWATSDELELHRSVPTSRGPLKLMVEKDLVCIDRPFEERDPHAFPRAEKPVCT